MKAIVQHEYGPPVEVLSVGDVAEPEEVRADQVRIRVKAAAVNPLDWHFATGLPLFMRPMIGLRRPKRTRPGADVAGVVEAVGADVAHLAVGDEVFGEIPGGAFGEVAVAKAGGLVRKPESLSFDEAAAMPVAALTALQGLRDKGSVGEGSTVLINGASGGVGTFAIQIAKALGAEVTGVCSTPNVAQARELGADEVIDYRTDDFVEIADRAGRRYDVLFDIAGSRTISECHRVLTDRGIYVLVGGPKDSKTLGPLGHMLKTMVRFVFSRRKLGSFVARATVEDMTVLREMVDAGQLRPVVERRIALADVPNAVGCFAGGGARGKTVVVI